MNQNNGLEARTSKKEVITTLRRDLREIPPQVITTSLQDPTSHMGITIRKMKDHMTNAQISQLLEAMDIDFEMNLSTIRLGTSETMEDFLVLHRLKGEISHKISHTANQEVINLTILLSADLTIDLQPALHPTNKYFHNTITRRHLMWFASQQPKIPSMKYQTFVL